MLSTILSAIEAIRAVLPEGTSLSIQVHPNHHTILLHDGADWMRTQGATVGSWYGFDGDAGTCQRNLDLTIEGVALRGVERNTEAGVTIFEARAEETARVASLAA
jgi:hypothetical protein